MLSEFLKVTNFIQIHLFLNPSLLEKRLKGDHFMQTSCGSLFAQRIILKIFNHLLCCSVTKSFPTLWSHGLQHAKLCCPSLFSEYTQIHVNWVGDAIQPSHPLLPAFSPVLNLSHSGTLAWKVPWMEEPGRLQSMGSLRVAYDWVTSLSPFTFMYWRRKWQPTPGFLPAESQGWRRLAGCRLRGHTELDTTEGT